MSLNEVDRLKILGQIKLKEITQIEGAKRIGIGKRQMIRVYKLFKKEGLAGVISKKRGNASNNRLPDKVREGVLKAIKTKYSDFGPTLAHEKIVDEEGFQIGLESVRQLMIKSGLWTSKLRKRIKPHQMRTRRPQRGELIQIDGSPHDWFEGRSAKCCLLVAIDDATSEVMAAFFIETESLEGYFKLMEYYLSQHGRPMALYSDKHGIFRVNAKEAASGTGETQFSRAMRELGIDLICAVRENYDTNYDGIRGNMEELWCDLPDGYVLDPDHLPSKCVLKDSDGKVINADSPGRKRSGDSTTSSTTVASSDADEAKHYRSVSPSRLAPRASDYCAGKPDSRTSATGAEHEATT